MSPSTAGEVVKGRVLMKTESTFPDLATTLFRALYGEDDCPQTLAELQQISPAELEALYGVGHRLLTSGKAHEAAAIFHVLCLLDHQSERYRQALEVAEDALQPVVTA